MIPDAIQRAAVKRAKQEAIELIVQEAWSRICRLEVLDSDELAPHVRGLAETAERLNQITLRATVAHYEAMAKEAKERQNETCTDAAD